MQKIMFFMCMLVIIMMTACSNYKHEETPLEGAPNLASYTILGEDQHTVLTGVRDTSTGKIIVPSNEYKSITADAYTISCTDSNNFIHAYKTDGTLLGKFELFTHWSDKGINYYIGVYYNTSLYYFPLTNRIIKAERQYSSINALFLFDGLIWDILDFSGNMLWQTMTDNFVIITDSKYIDKTNIVIPDPETSTCKIYTTTGELIKKLSKSQWSALQKRLKKTVNLSNDKQCYAAICDNIEKI